MNPYTGSWTTREAAHLLRRTTFGPSKSMVDDSVANGLDTTIQQLFSNTEVPDPPVKYMLDEPIQRPYNILNRLFDNVDDPNVSYEETWVNAPIVTRTGDAQRDAKINNYRIASLYAWLYDLMNKSGVSIREKMTIFWHNHFVVSEFRLPHMMYQYMATIQDNVVGDFKALTKAMTIDPSMLLYLNGNENVNGAPNENYARELLELFTIGKGDLAGPGDYSNYTEDDIREIAKALTGWTLDLGSLQGNKVGVVFFGFAHDSSTKQLSHRFNNAVITNAGQNEYSNVVDIIFEQDEVSRFICRKLYRYFVHYDITDAVEMDVIEPMAQILRDNNYTVEPALKALLSSEHFFSEEAIGCMIKNPADYVTSSVRGLNFFCDGDTHMLANLELIPPGIVSGAATDYINAIIQYQISADGGMNVFNHPDVAGWKAYYQIPQYYRVWINTVTLPIRTDNAAKFVNGGNIVAANSSLPVGAFVPVLEIIADINGVEDPNVMINELADHILPYGVTEDQKDFLKEILIPGLPDFEWTVEYTDYLSDPGDPQKKEAVENRLRALFAALLVMPEAQLM